VTGHQDGAAAAAGADVIVAPGAEAGEHGSCRATLPLVPAVADAVARYRCWRPAGSPTGEASRPR
jgi:NAD(P)H-dependent flavin oxidoreductase YrpB (nitropropane dioxygenase family)